MATGARAIYSPSSSGFRIYIVTSQLLTANELEASGWTISFLGLLPNKEKDTGTYTSTVAVVGSSGAPTVRHGVLTEPAVDEWKSVAGKSGGCILESVFV